MSYAIKATFHSLPVWPYTPTPAFDRRSGKNFRASWSDTLYELQYELDKLEAFNVVVSAGFQEGDIRLDGDPTDRKIFFTRALKRAHPDGGGDGDLFAAVQDAGRILGVNGGR